MPTVFPRARWVALLWLAVWVPTYWVTWGWQNFLLFCDVAVILTCVGIWFGNSLLLSSQVVTLIFNLAWLADLLWFSATRTPLFGGTDYMWDARFPLWVRLISFFHLALPVVQFQALRRTGYDPRGWKLQSAITAGLMLVCLALRPEKNLNYIYSEPIFGRAWGPPLVHLLVVSSFIAFVFYWPTHRALQRLWKLSRE